MLNSPIGENFLIDRLTRPKETDLESIFFVISKQMLNSVTHISICTNLQSRVFDHKAIILSFVPSRKEGIVRPTISHTILRDPDLDLCRCTGGGRYLPGLNNHQE